MTGSEPRVDWDEVARLTRAGLSAPAIAVVCRCSVRTVSRIRVAMGVGQPVAPHQGQPIDPVRLAKARQMLDDGASFREISLTHHIHYNTLARYFPGRGYTKAQMREAALMAEQFNRIPNHLTKGAQ